MATFARNIILGYWPNIGMSNETESTLFGSTWFDGKGGPQTRGRTVNAKGGYSDQSCIITLKVLARLSHLLMFFAFPAYAFVVW